MTAVKTADPNGWAMKMTVGSGEIRIGGVLVQANDVSALLRRALVPRNVVLSDHVQLRREFNARDVPKRKLGGDKKYPTLSRSQINEVKARVVDLDVAQDREQESRVRRCVRFRTLDVNSDEIEAAQRDIAARLHVMLPIIETGPGLADQPICLGQQRRLGDGNVTTRQ